MKHIVTVRTFDDQGKENVMKFGASNKSDAFDKAYSHLKNNEHTGAIGIDYETKCDDAFKKLTVRLVHKTDSDKQQILDVFSAIAKREDCNVKYDWRWAYVDIEVESNGKEYCLRHVTHTIMTYLYKLLGKIEFD